jgi:hypothetical protein
MKISETEILHGSTAYEGSITHERRYGRRQSIAGTEEEAKKLPSPRQQLRAYTAAGHISSLAIQILTRSRDWTLEDPPEVSPSGPKWGPKWGEVAKVTLRNCPPSAGAVQVWARFAAIDRGILRDSRSTWKRIDMLAEFVCPGPWIDPAAAVIAEKTIYGLRAAMEALESDQVRVRPWAPDARYLPWCEKIARHRAGWW